MRHTIRYYISILLLSAAIGASAADPAAATLFPYPTVPTDITDFTDRADYFVTHFWDECRFKSEFSSRQRFEDTFEDYAQMLPHATETAALSSIDNLIAHVAKSSPANLLTLGEIAESMFYDGKVGFVSDALYLPFVKAVAGCKKLSGAEKARFVSQVKVLENTVTGAVAPDFTYTDINGKKARFAERPKLHTILFINDPECDDCRMARVRLSADYYLGQFIDKGQLQVISIYPGEYSAEWAAEAVDNADPKWTVGACADIDDIYDLRTSPAIYYLDREGHILSKTADVDTLLNGFYNVYTQQNK